MTGFKSFQLPPPLVPEKIPQFLAGYMLISETELKDPNFFRTVVLILNHDSNGAMGLIINRPSETQLGEISPEMRQTPFSEHLVYIGGPVDQHYLFALHSGFPGGERSDGAIEVGPKILFEPDIVVLQKNFERLPDDYGHSLRFFAGYAGWASTQLEAELQRGDWLVIPAVQELVFNEDPEETWRQALYKKGGLYWLAAETGYKPSVN
ncbi:MAG TPA: YqgE/AlgH family protein [Sediminispirochaeta sp.]|nr:YqgE/AlgH family protein [Sediminispirochaeta sp.]